MHRRDTWSMAAAALKVRLPLSVGMHVDTPRGRRGRSSGFSYIHTQPACTSVPRAIVVMHQDSCNSVLV